MPAQTQGVRLPMKYFLSGLLLLIITAGTLVATPQEIYTTDQLDYTIELPSSVWRSISESDSGRAHAEFINGDRLEGYLQIRKEGVDSDTTASALARRDLDQKLRFLPGFIE